MTAHARVSQDAIEVAVAPTSQKVLASQDVVEVAVSPTSQKVRLSQDMIEVALAPNPHALISQYVVEIALHIYAEDPLRRMLIGMP